MKRIRWIAWVLPLALAVTACERSRSRMAGPEPARAPEVSEAHWVWGDGLRGAVESAARSPLVERAIAESPNPRLTARWDLAVRAVGRMTDGSSAAVTILPYVVDGDPAHAMFISYLESDGRQIAEPTELILGREPTSLETGFRAISLGDRIGWIKSGAAHKIGAASGIERAAERRKWLSFIECLLDNAPAGCAAGANIANEIAPGVPRAQAIGCGIGVAVVAVGCALEHLF